MKNYVFALVLAVLVVLAGVTLRRSVAANNGAAAKSQNLVAIGTSPVPPIPPSIGTSPVPPIPPNRTVRDSAR